MMTESMIEKIISGMFSFSTFWTKIIQEIFKTFYIPRAFQIHLLLHGCFFLKRARKNAILWFLLFLSLFLQSNRWFLIGIISFLPQMSLSDMSMFVATTSKCFTTILTYVWSIASMCINVILKIWFGFKNFPTMFTFVAFWVFWFDNSFYNNLVNSPKMRSQFICNITSFTIWNYNK